MNERALNYSRDERFISPSSSSWSGKKMNTRGTDDKTSVLTTLYRSSLIYLYVSAACWGGGVKCVDTWRHADFNQKEPGDWSNNEGFTYDEWSSLAWSCYLLPLALVLNLIWVVQAMKETPENHVIVLIHFIVVWIASVVMMDAGHVMAKGIFSCGVVFCAGADHDKEIEENEHDASTQGMGYFYFFTGMIFLFIYSFCIFKLMKSVCTTSSRERYSQWTGRQESRDHSDLDPSTLNKLHNEADMSAEGSISSEPSNPKPALRLSGITSESTICPHFIESKKRPIDERDTWITLFLVFGILYPFYIVCCMLLPTWWAGFTRSDLLEYFKQDLSVDYDASFPEGQGMYWRSSTQNGKVVYKMFPDILLFYLFIYMVAGIAVAAQVFPEIRRALGRRPMAFSLVGLGGMRVGEVALGVGIIGQLVSQFAYWYFDKVYEFDNEPRTNKEIAARALGQVANVCCGLMVLPVARNSVWTKVFGLGHEVLIQWHTYLGGTFLVIILLHMVMWWVAWDDKSIGAFPDNILRVPLTKAWHTDDFTVPLSQLCSFLMWPFMGLGSMYVVRRKAHEVFYWLHHFSLPIFYVMTWHATMSWYFISAGLFLYGVDFCIRLYKCIGRDIFISKSTVVAHTLSAANGGLAKGSVVTRLAYTTRDFSIFGKKPKDPLNAKPGQYCYINIPAISRLEWHPFTISSGGFDTHTTHHIKSMGSGTWTAKLGVLMTAFKAGTAPDAFIGLQVDGPYGVPIPYQNYAEVLLVCGGIGVTPMMALVKHLHAVWSVDPKSYPNLRLLKMVWVSRSVEELSLFSAFFEELVRVPCKAIQVELYCSTATNDAMAAARADEVQLPLPVKAGRPNVKEEVARLALFNARNGVCSDGTLAQSLVHVCGPPTVIDICAREALKHNVDFSSEVFNM